MDTRWGTVTAGVAGVFGFALTIAGSLIAGEFDVPEPTEPRAQIVEYYQSIDFDQARWGLSIEILGFLLLFAFSLKLAHVLGKGERGLGWGGLLITAGAVLTWTVTLVSYAPWLAGAYRASHGGLPDDGYLMLHDIQFFFYPLFLMTAPLFLLPAGLATLHTGLLPRWLGWAAVLLSPAMFLTAVVDPTALRIADFLAGLWGVWIFVAAVFMLVRLDMFSETDVTRESRLPATERGSPARA